MSGWPPHDLGPHWGEVGIHGVHRFREWDTVATIEVAGPPGVDELEFVALPDGRTLPPEAEALAREVEHELPYRARAVRRGERLWVIGSRAIVVEERLEPGDEFERVQDGVVVRGHRLSGSFWEIERARL